jgi:hypothetical protein
VLIETHDEWQVAERRYLSEESRPSSTLQPDRDQHDHDQKQTGVIDTDTILTTKSNQDAETAEQHAERAAPPPGTSSWKCVYAPVRSAGTRSTGMDRLRGRCAP